MARNFNRERLAVSALIAATAVLCVGGSLSQFLPLPDAVRGGVEVVLVIAFAALCGFSLWVANVAAACAQVLADRRGTKPWAFAIALFTAALTGLVSVIGVDLAWMTLTGEQQAYPATGWIIAAGFALGFVKVAMGFVLEACEQIASREARAEDALVLELRRQVRELEAEVRALKRAAPSNEPAQAHRTGDRTRNEPRKRPGFVRRATAAGAAALLMTGAANAPAHASPVAPHEPAPRAQAGAKVSDAVRAKARARIAAGERPAVVSRDTGVPHSTCKRWSSELGALRA